MRWTVIVPEGPHLAQLRCLPDGSWFDEAAATWWRYSFLHGIVDRLALQLRAGPRPAFTSEVDGSKGSSGNKCSC